MARVVTGQHYAPRSTLLTCIPPTPLYFSWMARDTAVCKGRCHHFCHRHMLNGQKNIFSNKKQATSPKAAENFHLLLFQCMPWSLLCLFCCWTWLWSCYKEGTGCRGNGRGSALAVPRACALLPHPLIRYWTWWLLSTGHFNLPVPICGYYQNKILSLNTSLLFY